MRRTTIFLPDALHSQLREEAFRSRISMAELIRSRLERKSRRRKDKKAHQDLLAEVEGMFRDGRLSQGIDEALYGN